MGRAASSRAARDGRRVSIPVRAGRYLATISAPAGVADELRSTLRDLVRPEPSPAGAAMVIDEAPGRYQVSVDHRLWAPGENQTLVDQVVYVLLRSALDAEPELLHLHAGYVALDGRGVLIAGFPGSGKSTLVAELVRDGFDYLTEERVALDGSLELTSFAKPISVVEGSFPALAAYDPARTGVGSVSPRFWHIPASGLGGGRVVDAARPVALVFARYDAASTTAVRAVHPAEAARLLLADSPDAGRYGPGALRVTVDLVSTIPCVELTFSASAEAIAAVRDLVRQSQVTTADHPVAELPGSAPASAPRATPTAVDRGAVLGRPGGVSGVLVGSRCLVWREGGEIVELDEVGTVWMQLLDGVTPLGELIDEVVEATGTDPGATTTSVLATVRGLAALGVVA